MFKLTPYRFLRAFASSYMKRLLAKHGRAAFLFLPLDRFCGISYLGFVADICRHIPLWFNSDKNKRHFA